MICSLLLLFILSLPFLSVLLEHELPLHELLLFYDETIHLLITAFSQMKADYYLL